MLTLAHDIRGQVSKQARTHRLHAVRTDFHELINDRESSQNDPVPYLYMTGQLRVICKNGVVAHDTVMGQVHIRHQPIVIPHSRDASASGGSYVECRKLANSIAIANNQLTRLTRILFVLRNSTQGAELKYPVIPSNGGVALHHTVRSNGRARTDADMGTNERVSPNRNTTVEFSGRVNNSG